MKTTLLLPSFPYSLALISLLAFAGSSVHAQIYRCNGASGAAPEYINNAKDAQTRGCKMMEGGNITVVQGPPVQKTVVRVAAVSNPAGISPSTRTDGNPEQKTRDSESRGILESELKKAEARLVEQQKEYSNGEPEKQGIEGRNYQRYLDRVAGLKDGITRNQSDIAGIKREIARLPSVN